MITENENLTNIILSIVMLLNCTFSLILKINAMHIPNFLHDEVLNFDCAVNDKAKVCSIKNDPFIIDDENNKCTEITQTFRFHIIIYFQ